MKILYVIENRTAFKNTKNIGGYLSHVVGVVEAFHRLGHEVCIAAYDDIPYLDKEKFRYMYLQNGKPIRIPFLQALSIQSKFIQEVIRTIKEYNPDLLYLRWTGNLFISKIRKDFPELPIAVECNGVREMSSNGGNFINKMYMRSYDKQYVKNATVISAITNDVRNYLLDRHPRLTEDRIITNPNGVDVQKFRYIKSDIRRKIKIYPDIPVIGFAGVFMPWHKVEIIIQAVQQLSTDVRLLLVGEGKGEYASYLKTLAQEQKSERIIFTGAVPHTDIPQWLSTCDILVVPQAKERPLGSSIKLFEYMATGRAVAAANVGQLPEIIKNGENGLIFEPDPDDLKRVLNRLIEDKPLREKLGKKAREDVEANYTWEANVTRILNAL